MKSANLSCGFMALLLLVSVLFARPAAADVSALGCGIFQGNEKPTLPATVYLNFPANKIDEEVHSIDSVQDTLPDPDPNGNNTLGYAGNPRFVIYKPVDSGQVLLTQTFLIKIYCEITAADKSINGDHPKIHIDDGFTKHVVSRLSNRGLMVEFKVEGNKEGWKEITDHDELVYQDIQSVTFNTQAMGGGGSLKPAGYYYTSPGVGGVASTDGVPIKLSLRLKKTGPHPIIPPKENDYPSLIPGDMFRITPTGYYGTMPHITVTDAKAITFAVAQCRPTVELSPTILDFGTLTQYGLNRGGKYGRDVTITMRKRFFTCGSSPAHTSDNYAITGVKVRFTSTEGQSGDSLYAMLNGEDNKTFPGLALYVFRGSQTTPIPFGNFYPLYSDDISSSLLSEQENDKDQNFKFVIKKAPTGDEIATGLFHGSVRVEVVYN